MSNFITVVALMIMKRCGLSLSLSLSDTPVLVDRPTWSARF